MFTGNYSINMDAKGRMAIPTRVREGLVDLCAGRLVVTAHTEDKCLLVYPEPRWREILPSIQALPAMNKQARRVQRLLIGHACSLELDANGRILVPPTLRSYANLDKKLMLAGLGDKLELWDEAAWTAQMEEPGDDQLPERTAITGVIGDIMGEQPHITVLEQQAVDALVTDVDGFYVDGTFGRGGHTARLLGSLSPGARVLAIDKDLEAIDVAHQRFAGESRFAIEHASFSQLQHLVEARGMLGKVSGVLLDLGVSSPQLDEPERGFSFLHDGPLDMRMDQSQGMSAAEWVNSASEGELARVMKDYGEERFAKRMARALVAEREKSPIERTARLAQILKDANPAWEKGKHPATRAFQGIRIHINNELADIEAVLQQALEVLAVGGRLVVISFHSLEDRLVKRFIRRQEKGDPVPRGIPLMESQLNRRLKSRSKAIKADSDEVGSNVRSRSAVMRIAEKIG